MSSVLDTTCENLPSFASFLRLSIQSGTLNWRGFWMMVTRRSTSSAESSPARLPRSISAFLQAMFEKRR